MLVHSCYILVCNLKVVRLASWTCFIKSDILLIPEVSCLPKSVEKYNSSCDLHPNLQNLCDPSAQGWLKLISLGDFGFESSGRDQFTMRNTRSCKQTNIHTTRKHNESSCLQAVTDDHEPYLTQLYWKSFCKEVFHQKVWAPHYIFKWIS